MTGTQQQQAKPRGDGKTFMVPTEDQILNAVISLYADRLEPFGRILLRRIREQHVESMGLRPEISLDDAPYIEPQMLRRLCQMSCKLTVKPAEGKEIVVFLRDKENTDFVDVCSDVDNFPAQVWEQATAYFESFAEGELVLPGGRYASAHTLKTKNLPFLEGLCLGEICQFVQLAISQKALLGHAEGGMVPYTFSHAAVKEQLAACQLRVPKRGEENVTAYPVATWEQVRLCMMAILEGTPEGAITISNVKRLFTDRFGLELSETALGYSRFSDLLHDPRLKNVCCVEPQGSACMVVSTRPGPAVCYASPGLAWNQADASAGLPAAYDAAAYEATMPWTSVDDAAAMAAAREAMPWISSAEDADEMAKWPLEVQDWLQQQHRWSEAAASTFYGEARAELSSAVEAPVAPPPGLGAPKKLSPPPGVHVPYMLNMPPMSPPPGLTPEAWEATEEEEETYGEPAGVIAASSPMKISSVPIAFADGSDATSFGGEDAQAVAFLQRSAGTDALRIECKKDKPLPRHRRSSSVSTNIDSEDTEEESDSGAQEQHDASGEGAVFTYGAPSQLGSTFLAAAR